MDNNMDKPMGSSLKRLKASSRRSITSKANFSLTPKRLNFANFDNESNNEDSSSSSNNNNNNSSSDEATNNSSPEKPKIRLLRSPCPAPQPRFAAANELKRPLPKIRLLRSPSPKSQRLVTSPCTAPRFGCGAVNNVNGGRISYRKLMENRRGSAPVGGGLCWTPVPGGRHRRQDGQEGWEDEKKIRKNRLANINPFTPAPFNISSTIKKEKKDQENRDSILRQQVVMAAGITPTTTSSSSSASMGQSPSFSNLDIPNVFQSLVNDKDDSPSKYVDILVDMKSPLNPSKRIKVRDINVSRFEDEFLELKELVSGNFGQVKLVRHRLDGMIYAIKVNKSPVISSGQERAIMNEVFAHAALMKHKHIVRYYNSWVENGHIYIQNEFCEGGSLADMIERSRKSGKPISENEIKRITSQLTRGLQYIHSKNLVHLDIKPENIFLSLDHVQVNPNKEKSAQEEEEDDDETSSASTITKGEEKENSSLNTSRTMSSSSEEESMEQQMEEEEETKKENIKTPSTSRRVSPEKEKPSSFDDLGTPKRPVLSTPTTNSSQNRTSDDSGHASCDNSKCSDNCQEKISYKIGDLGHVAQVNDDYGVPEEGDCRYFAPELLLHHIDQEKLFKADIFSLGLTLYECATLVKMPKNSEDSDLYEKLRTGCVPPVPGYSKEFNQLIKSMISPDPMLRPSAARILAHPFVKLMNRQSKKNYELYKELKAAKKKVRELQKQCLFLNKNGISKFGAISTTLAQHNGVTLPPKRLLVGKGTRKSRSSYE